MMLRCGTWGEAIGAAVLVIILDVSSPVRGQAAEESQETVIEVWKDRRQMELREGDTLVRRFQIALGRAPQLTKQVRGDKRTPVGRYYVSEKRRNSRFHRFLGINYPNADDAERAYESQLISASQWADIFLADLRGQVPASNTPLGGRIGIHGHAGRPVVPVDWTDGCIAIGDEEIDFLYDRVPLGTAVIIHE